jgi:glycosyltransferase involved in cell wall biosynthesis
MNRISACLITLNEEHNLPRALASLAGVADEIVVVDAGSADGTMAIARKHGAAVFLRSWTNYSEQKNFAAERAKNDWILSLDADEELSTELAQSVLEWKTREAECSVYDVARKTWYLGAWIRHSGWYPDYQRRLYRKDQAKFAGIVHESLQFTGAVGRLRGDLHHFTVRSFAEHEANVERYTTLAAEQMYEAGRRSWRGGMWLVPGWSWFRTFVLQAGFLDGRRGWLIARMAARSVRRKYRKLGELVRRSAEVTSAGGGAA